MLQGLTGRDYPVDGFLVFSAYRGIYLGECFVGYWT
jgi:hypothetical protein